MNYQISIKFSNIEKTGKLTIRDSNKKIILNKSPVTIPENIGVFFAKNNLKKTMNNELFSKSIADENGKVILVGKERENGKLTSELNAFVVDLDVYNLLSNLLSKNNSFSLEAEKVTFLFNTEHINKAENNNVVNTINLKKLEIKEKIKIEESNVIDKNKTVKTNFHLNNKLLSKDIKSEIIPNKNLVEKIKTNIGINNTSTQKQKTFQSTNISTGSSSSNTNDPLLNHLMYMNPAMAAMYSPAMLLAWAAVFGDDLSSISKSEINNNIKNVSGLEGVNNIDLKYTGNGYNVELYEDESKEKLAGTLHFDTSNNTQNFSLVSPDGYKTEIVNNGHGWDGISTNDSGNSISYHVEENNNTFVWADTTPVENTNYFTNDTNNIPYYEQNNNNNYSYTPEPEPIRYDPPPVDNWSSSNYDTNNNYGSSSSWGNDNSNSSSEPGW